MPQTARAGRTASHPPLLRRRAPKSGRFRRSAIRLVAGLLLITAAYWVLCVCGLFLLKWIPPMTTMVQMQRRVEALVRHRPYRKRYQFVRLGAISPNLQHAAIAAEDGRFYQHHGIDWKAVDTVVQESLEEGEVTRGASTITQQLVKNLFATTWRNPMRKLLEFSLAPVADCLLGKQRTLELYLNAIEWGPGVYGAEAASEYYFRTPAARLTRDEAARLAAIIPAPLRRKPARMVNYSEKIETRMQQMGW